MGPWDRRLARLLRALIACTVLLFAAQGGAMALEQVRDTSAWLARSAVGRAAAASVAQPVPASRLRRTAAQVAVVARAQHPVSTPLAGRAAADERYLYLALLTLRC